MKNNYCRKLKALGRQCVLFSNCLLLSENMANEILMSLRAEKKSAGEVSLSEPIGTDKDGNEISLAEILGTDGEDVQNQVEQTLFGTQLKAVMDRVLTERERMVIQLRYGLDGCPVLPQREIAKRLGISRSYV